LQFTNLFKKIRNAKIQWTSQLFLHILMTLKEILINLMRGNIAMTEALDFKGLVERARTLTTTVLADAIDRQGIHGTMDVGIRNLAGPPVAGWAVTVERRPIVDSVNAPNLSLGTQGVIDNADPGSIVVIGAYGDVSSACWGGLMTIRAHFRGIAGLVVDGCVRDVQELQELGFPTFARATSPRMAVGRLTTPAIGTPVRCGGLLVSPGDLIVADADGVLAIPRFAAARVIDIAEQISAVEHEMGEALRGGLGMAEAVKRFKQR
jgi:4-hydroxy-4-methyl-2-oxoglutarate aldolase